MCLEQGIVRVATVCDHRTPHKGDEELFYGAENHQSLCKAHHDGAKQSEESIGFSKAIGADGLPTDPRHPFNRER